MSRLLLLLLILLPALHAQNKDAPKKEPPPKVVVVPQLGIDLGKTTKLTVRGTHVDTATEVHLQEPKASGKIVGNARKVPPPNNIDPKQVGDSEIDIEITLPSEVPGRTVSFSLVGTGGESPPHPLIINDGPRIQEKEPNDGFRQAQPVTLPTVIEGKVQQNQDVDVFRVEGKAGQTLQAEVQARRFGSPLEPMLYLYDASSQLLTSAEASTPGSDPTLTFKLPRDGVYYLVLLDAHDQGGAIFVYRLHLTN